MTDDQISTKDLSPASDHPLRPGFGKWSIWAFSIGTSIGWGSLVVTCNIYLAQAGIAGTVSGLLLGMLVILVITRNLRYMICRSRDALLETLKKLSSEKKCPVDSTLAVGMATFRKETDKSLSRVFNRADQRMYREKTTMKKEPDQADKE